jgi:hypothetical protein
LSLGINRGVNRGQEAVKKLPLGASDRRQLPEVLLLSDITRVRTLSGTR